MIFPTRTIALAAMAAALTMSAPALAGRFDGTWNVDFTPTAGNCHANYRTPFAVSGSRVVSAGGGKTSGGVRSNGRVAVRISVGLTWAESTGRLVGNTGSGRWAGLITGDKCSGVWQATRG